MTDTETKEERNMRSFVIAAIGMIICLLLATLLSGCTGVGYERDAAQLAEAKGLLDDRYDE